jgi:hypothetical protein
VTTRNPYEKPHSRPLQVFTFDPVLRGAKSMKIDVPYEDLKPGPVGKLLQVIDYDASNELYYPPLDLDDPRVLIGGGLAPSDSDPRFHQQMVYAVVSETIRRFQFALGREPKWNRDLGGRIERLHGRLRVLPHAMQEANAFYDRKKGLIAFGYFTASETDAGDNLPGQVIFTCLSHDIIAHETTHALIDGQKLYFLERTGLDSPAFHEAFADVVALLQHFSYRDVLVDVLRRTGGVLYRSNLAPGTTPGPGGPQIQDELTRENPLVKLAQQFGQAMGMRAALRSALGSKPDPAVLKTVTEPHARGSILVAAIFDAFFSIYMRRTRDLLRLGHAAGRVETDDVHPDLADRLAGEARKTADHFTNICIRALDYCPPVDIQFGDFLRAMITADSDLVADDPMGYRQALIDAFRARGIFPEGVASFAEDALRWSPPDAALSCPGLHFDPFTPPDAQQNAANAKTLHEFADKNREALRLTRLEPKPGDTEPLPKVQVLSFHPVDRIGPDGQLKRQIVVELMQQYEDVPLLPGDESSPKFSFRGGTTVVFDEKGDVRYAIYKPVGLLDDKNQRLKRQREYYGQLDLDFASATYLEAPDGSGRPLSVLDQGTQMQFDLIHRGL